ncbi:MAG: SDR family oxidoreductase [Ardenticatenaceae bacterium]|nr:SDR family oxidoreductase [Anaerolineales bacterium]MCB8942125.1 SDR family oxidoreductase [Ardenticatenaceae bacterium]MCB8973149.1 SDR family oxidoreductase [Ardenticatenaceae bacterium]
MKLAVFGATGGTGREIVAQALDAGHEVTVLVRDPARLSVKHNKLYLVIGDVLNLEKVEEALAGSEAVCCSLGNTANNPDFVVSDGTQNIIEVMKKQAIRRLVVVSALGVGDTRDRVSLSFKMLMKTVLRKAYEDKERQEQFVRESDLDWVIVRPGGLTNGSASGEYAFGMDASIGGGQVSRADVAAFVLQQLTDDTFLHQTPAIA